jgi:hypothetical protein
VGRSRMPIAWMRRVNTRPKARSLSRTIYVGARSQGNASVIWRANHSAVGQRDRNKALFLFDQDSFLLRALGATEYALLVTGRVGRLNAIKPHTPAAVRTQRLFSNRLLDCLRQNGLQHGNTTALPNHSITPYEPEQWSLFPRS